MEPKILGGSLPLQIVVGHHSEQGVRPNMEDEVFMEAHFNSPGSQIADALAFFGVFDGHGGRNAAIYTRDHLHKLLIEELKGKSPDEALVSAYLRTDQDFLKAGGDTSGTTCVTLLIERQTKKLWVANAGDSRAILCRQQTAIPLSKDHKADRPDEIERIRKAGGFVIHKRVMGELAVSRAIGDSDFKEKDCKLVIAEPEIISDSLREGDEFIVLACDGLYDVMSNDDIVKWVSESLRKHGNPELTCKEIVKHAIETKSSRDNVSVIIVWFKPYTSPDAADASSPADAASSSSATSSSKSEAPASVSAQNVPITAPISIVPAAAQTVDVSPISPVPIQEFAASHDVEVIEDASHLQENHVRPITTTQISTHSSPIVEPVAVPVSAGPSNPQPAQPISAENSSSPADSQAAVTVYEPLSGPAVTSVPASATIADTANTANSSNSVS